MKKRERKGREGGTRQVGWWYVQGQAARSGQVRLICAYCFFPFALSEQLRRKKVCLESSSGLVYGFGCGRIDDCAGKSWRPRHPSEYHQPPTALADGCLYTISARSGSSLDAGVRIAYCLSALVSCMYPVSHMQWSAMTCLSRRTCHHKSEHSFVAVLIYDSSQQNIRTHSILLPSHKKPS